MMIDLSVAILAGGLATRLRPLTENLPKSMVMVADRPFIQHQIELLKSCGLQRFVLCVGYKGEMIESFLGDGSQLGVDIRYSYDGDRQLGTGGAIKKALKQLEGEFFVLYGDSYLPINYEKMANSFVNGGNYQGMMSIYHNSNQRERSNVRLMNDPEIYYDKHSACEDNEMEFIDYGVSILKKSAFDSISINTEFDLATLYNQLSKQRLLIGWEVHEPYYEIGSFAGIAELSNFLVNKGNPTC